LYCIPRNGFGDSAGYFRLISPVLLVQLDVPLKIRFRKLDPNAPGVVVVNSAEKRKFEEAANKSTITELAQIAVELRTDGALSFGDSPYDVGQLPAIVGWQALVSFAASRTDEGGSHVWRLTIELSGLPELDFRAWLPS